MLMNNRISELPDDILIHVLSYLTIKDAERTSILSKRWKHLWAYIPTLIFDSRKITDEMNLATTSFYVEELKFLCWVHKAISLHKAPILDEFRVRFDVTSKTAETYKNVFDDWLRFAMEKKVKMLEVNLFRHRELYNAGYTFPQSLSCNSLTSLELVSVNVTGEILESYLRNCLALEWLSVKNSQSLVKLTVGGPLLKLKSLIIVRCFSMKTLEICAPNLVSACYVGRKTDVQFKSTPKLAQVFFGFEHADNLIHCFSDLSSYLSQIEVLTLSPCASVENIILPAKDLVFPRLRKLDVAVAAFENGQFFLFRSLMKACPFLLHFTLRFKKRNVREVESRVMRGTPCPHYHLKTLEIVGFTGDAIQMEIAVSLIKDAVVLDKITVDPVKNHPEGIRRVRQRAKDIRPLLNPRTELEIR